MSDHAVYLRPTDLGEALNALADRAFRVAAGCTDLFPLTERKTLPGPVLDITRIEGLRGITSGSEGLRIGGATTWSDILDAALPPSCTGLKLAAAEVGARQIQNRATLAGNLCNASPAADGVPPLLTLEAEVELTSLNHIRRMPLDQFLTGPRQTQLRAGEIMTAIHLPTAALGGQGYFLKLGARDYLVISIAMTAARLVVEDGIVTQAALSVGSCGPVATRLSQLESRLVGHPPGPARIRPQDVEPFLTPIDDVRADAAYRTTAATELLRRTVAAAAQTRVRAA